MYRWVALPRGIYMCIVLSRNMGIVSLHFKDSNATCRSFLSLHRFSIRPDAVLVVLIVSIYGTTLLCASFVYKPSSSSSSPSIASSPNKSITCTAATTTTTTTTVTQKTTQVSNKTTPHYQPTHPCAQRTSSIKSFLSPILYSTPARMASLNTRTTFVPSAAETNSNGMFFFWPKANFFCVTL